MKDKKYYLDDNNGFAPRKVSKKEFEENKRMNKRLNKFCYVLCVITGFLLAIVFLIKHFCKIHL